MARSLQRHGGWSFDMRQDWIEVTSERSTPNERWQFTDANGHAHRYDHGYPTLTYVVDAQHWCHGDEGLYNHDEHWAVDEAHYECLICGVVVEPAMDPPYTPKHIPGMRDYTAKGTLASGVEVVFSLAPDEFDAVRVADADVPALMERFVAAAPDRIISYQFASR
jgi:hypothetical protein